MSEELKPCPFCGGEAKMHAAFAHGVASRVGVYVECGSCGAWSKTQWGDGAQGKAADAWNRRAERTCRKVPGKMYYGERRPKCSECGQSLGDRRWAYCPKCGARVIEEES